MIAASSGMVVNHWLLGHPKGKCTKKPKQISDRSNHGTLEPPARAPVLESSPTPSNQCTQSSDPEPGFVDDDGLISQLSVHLAIPPSQVRLRAPMMQLSTELFWTENLVES